MRAAFEEVRTENTDYLTVGRRSELTLAGGSMRAPGLLNVQRKPPQKTTSDVGRSVPLMRIDLDTKSIWVFYESNRPLPTRDSHISLRVPSQASQKISFVTRRFLRRSASSPSGAGLSWLYPAEGDTPVIG